MRIRNNTFVVARVLWVTGAIITGASGVLMLLWFTERLELPTSNRLLLMVGSGKRLWNIPAEVLLSLGFVVCAMASRTAGAIVLSSVLFGVAAGLVSLSPQSMVAWSAAIIGVTAAWICLARIRTSPRSFVYQLVAELRSMGDERCRLRAAAIAFGVLLALHAIHADVSRSVAETSFERRALSWYASMPATDSVATTRLEVFTDYQCPACRKLVPEDQRIAREVADKGLNLTVQIRDFPLDPSCNAHIPTAFNPHPVACLAAAARRLVEKVEGEAGASPFSDWLYSRHLTASTIHERLASIGLESHFNAESANLLELVRMDAAAGAAYGVKGTPSVVLNSRLVPISGPRELRRVLDYEAKRQALMASR